MELKYDKLKHMEISKDNSFDFICPNCQTNGMKKNKFIILIFIAIIFYDWGEIDKHSRVEDGS